MLVSGQELLDWAVANTCAVASFNTYNLETTRAFIQAAESTRQPIFLALGSGALAYGDFATLVALAKVAAETAKVAVALHLDHGESPEVIKQCFEAGFTSFMFDGSQRPLDENIHLTRAAREQVGTYPLEAELGGVGGNEDAAGTQDSNVPMTDPQDAARLVHETGVQSLAVAIGNAHGIYKGQPKLDFARLEQIHRAVDVPLVLHGASGIPDTDIATAIRHGVRKINVNTEIRGRFFETLQHQLPEMSDSLNLIGLMSPAIEAMAQTAAEKIKLFAAV